MIYCLTTFTDQLELISLENKPIQTFDIPKLEEAQLTVDGKYIYTNKEVYRVEDILKNKNQSASVKPVFSFPTTQTFDCIAARNIRLRGCTIWSKDGKFALLTGAEAKGTKYNIIVIYDTQQNKSAPYKLPSRYTVKVLLSANLCVASFTDAQGDKQYHLIDLQARTYKNLTLPDGFITEAY